MLTKDLVRYRVRKGLVHPKKVDPEDPALRDFAAALIDLFAESVGRSRGELARRTNEWIESAPVELNLARGFEKLLLDRTVFDQPADDALPALRHEVFAAASNVLRGIDATRPEAFAEAVAAEVGRPLQDMRETLFSDLPEHHPVSKFRPLTPLQLLHRYNCAQVQWLLLNSTQLHIELPAAEPASLRQLFKYLRFQRLLAEVSSDGRGGYTLTVDGPLNLFAAVKKYGLQLALFFPALLHQPRWSLRCELQIGRKKNLCLELDDRAGLVPLDAAFHAYVPREIRALEAAMTEKAPQWRLCPGADFLPLPGEAHCFPDFRLEHEDGFSIALELFHPWHKTQAVARLAQLEGRDPPPLIVGLARKLAKDQALARAAEDSPYFAEFGFWFIEIPAVSRLLAVLKRVKRRRSGKKARAR